MVRKTIKRTFATLFLTLLLAVHLGHAIHIHTEDPQRFAGFAGDLVPDNGATADLQANCLVCTFHLFPFLLDNQPPHQFYCELLAVLMPQATTCSCVEAFHPISPRAPPVV